MKKIIPFVALLSLSVFAQNETEEPKQKEIEAQEEAQNPEVKKEPQRNVYKIGPFDREGQYQFFDRQEKEAQEAENQKGQQQ